MLTSADFVTEAEDETGEKGDNAAEDGGGSGGGGGEAEAEVDAGDKKSNEGDDDEDEDGAGDELVAFSWSIT
jgi:hypothetical protein